MDKADVILMMTDIKSGVMPQDLALAKKLRQSDKTVILTVNKADNPGLRRKALGKEWLRLGLGEPMTLSAANGSGVGDMLDVVIERLEGRGLIGRPLPEPDVRAVIIGRPNVGKSSLLNAMAGEERVIVSEVPHTTKEPQDTLLTYTEPDGTARNVLLIDTVGIRKKAKVGQGIERLGVSMSIGEMARADVALLMIDAAEGVGMQERKLAGLIEKKNVGVLVIVNKWDLATGRGLGTAEEYAKGVAKDLPFLVFAPVVFISARTGDRVGRIMKRAVDIAKQRSREISDEELTSFLETLKKKHGAVLGAKKNSNRPKVYGIRQIGVRPPTFMVIGKKRETLHPNFMHFIENRLREEFGFEGTPIAVVSREIKAKGKK